MNVRDVCKWCAVSALVAVGSNFGLDRAISAQPVRADAQEGVQVLTRGPVHEAFAETVTFNPEPGIVVSKSPPAAIEELPPDQKPEGDNVAWIPGYWGWDDERSDFLWVSGIWRALPPGRQWVPGYWGKSEQGFQWTSGYWADAKVQTVSYLPEPPATVEVGPNIAAPSVDQNWLPGCWVWRQNRYAWRPGFWATVQPDWVWVPAHYVCAPRGYVFVEGYWDYSVGRRGVLFAPVYFDAGVYAQRGFSYSPTTVIDPGVFSEYLFVRPQYQHYYFGDYYAANYQDAGFQPSYAYNSGGYGYDPIYAHERWQHRQDPQWEPRVAADFQYRRDHEDARPPRTWAAQQTIGARGARSTGQGLAVATSLDQLATRTNGPLRFQPVDTAERHRLAQHGQEVQRFREQRQKLETQPPRVKLPPSPIVAKPVTELGKDHAPPQAYPAPKPDSKVEPRPRVIRPAEAILPRADLPQPKVDRAVPQPQPRGDGAQPQPQRKVRQPAPQPQPKVTQPVPQPQPQPKVRQPAPQPQPQPRVRQPAPQPQPKAQPAPQPQPQPKVTQPAPQPRPKVTQPAPQPQPQPKVTQPAPQPQPQPKVRQPAPQPQPQPKVRQPAPQPQPQPKVRQPAPQPQPKVDRPTGPPPAGPKEDKHKGKDKGKDK